MNKEIKKLSKDKLRILPLGGLGEIGMNALVLEYDEEIILVDCGLLFSDLEYFGVEFIIPDFTYLIERKDKIKGIVITHGHEDHIGAIPFALKAGIHAPIYASPFTSLLIQERLRDHGLADRTEIKTFQVGDLIKFKHFKIKTVSVNHSIVESVALFIDTPVGKVVHTGDFKVDPTPFYGKQLEKKIFEEAGKNGVLLLLSDSTNVEREQHSISESYIYKKFSELFDDAKGLILVSMFASNIGRMGQVFDLAKKLKKKVAVAGRSMDQNIKHAIEAGYLKTASKSLIALDDLNSYNRDKMIVLSSGSQAEIGSALFRIGIGEHRQLSVGEGDLVILSSRYIPGNEKAIGRMINSFFKQGAEVLYEAIEDIHVSGHATAPELKQMLKWVRPKFFIPVHGEYRHLVHHARLAQSCGVDSQNAFIAINGDVLELTENSLEKVDHLEDTRVLIEGRAGNDISRLVLKDRRQLGEKGVVFSLLVRNQKSQEILSGPEIISRGLVHENQEGWLVEEAKKQVIRVVKEYESQLHQNVQLIDLQETIRLELRRFFNKNIGKKPIVLPIILDL
ncbi:MAG: ribonuclease J [Bdellovibrio sp.]|nr:ribonuclease J [Bdellovibrio sp.]